MRLPLALLVLFPAKAAEIILLTYVSTPDTCPVTETADAISIEKVAQCSLPMRYARAFASAEFTGSSWAVAVDTRAFAPDSYAGARAAYMDTYYVLGGTGIGRIDLSFVANCGSGFNNVQPPISLSDGITTLVNPHVGSPCILSGPPNTGILTLPFEFGITPLTVSLDTTQLAAAVNFAPIYTRSATATARIYDAQGIELPGAYLVPTPEPGGLVLVGSALAATLVNRRRRTV